MSGTEEESATCEAMGIYRINKPQGGRYCGSDQSIDIAGNCGLSVKLEGAKRVIADQEYSTNNIMKARLNIPDMPMGGFSAGPAAPAAAPVEEEEAAPVQQEKTLFNLKLVSFDAGAKPKIIKEIKSMLGLSLVDSKKFVESAPKMMKEGVPKEECEKIITLLKGLGGVVTME